MAKLASNVLVDGKVYGPDSNVPDAVAAQITNPKAWEGGKVPSAKSATGSGAQPTSYDALKLDELKAQIDERNTDRDPDGETYIKPAAPGNKPELVAALLADDAAQAQA